MPAKDTPSAEVLHGGMRDKNRVAVLERIMCSSSPSPLVATGKYLGEGFDLPKLDTLFLALPVSWKGTLAQYAGRIHREHEGKTEVLIFDLTEYLHFSLIKRELSYCVRGEFFK